MREIIGNLWEVEADARVITTNGAVRRDGAAVMGRGVALQAKKRCPGIEYTLGSLILDGGNRVRLVQQHSSDECLISFPVKKHWRERASLFLIRKSAHELVQLTENAGYGVVALPRPGCGNGRLDWKKEVKPIIESILDDRFVVVYDRGGDGRL